MAKKLEHKQQKQYCIKFNKDFKKNDPHRKKNFILFFLILFYF